MTQEEITLAYDYIRLLLEKKQLKETFDELQKLSDNLHIWEIQEKIDELRTNYKLMLNYAIEGIADPEQKKIYFSLISACFRLLEELHEQLMSVNSHNYVYSQKRYFSQIGKNKELLLELETANSHKALSELMETGLAFEAKRKEIAQAHEELTNQLFKGYWLEARYTNADIQLFELLMESSHIAIIDKCLAISALFLSLMRYFDEERLLLLIKQCEHAEDAVSQRALVMLLPVLAKYNMRMPYLPAIRNRLVVLFDNESLLGQIKRIILQYIRTNDTERITRKMKEEIIPEMMKVAPKMKEMDFDSISTIEDPDEKNPEWQEILESSGIADKLKEISDLQMEGSDVYMSTFAMLKNFSFFQSIENWFRPFDPEQSAIYELFESKESAFLSAMMNNSLMCNSDRYSFCLSLMQMPESQRKMMSGAFMQESDQIKEIQKEDKILSKTKQTELISNAYIQDLYRFYRLFPHKKDFESPFPYTLDFHNQWFFSLLNFDNEVIRQIAEYYFSKDFFAQALQLFEYLENESENMVDLCQKIGYCYQRLNNISKALEYYLQAEIIAPDNKWSIRRIAYCYRLSKDYENALLYYKKAEMFSPDNTSIQLQLGNCYLNMRQYDSALAYYFKIEYATNENLKIWRAIAWTSFLAGKQEQAAKYYDKIIALNPDWTDYLNAGHVAWVDGRQKDAVAFYTQALANNGKDVDILAKSFAIDSVVLSSKGIDPESSAILLDYFRYQVEGQK